MMNWAWDFPAHRFCAAATRILARHRAHIQREQGCTSDRASRRWPWEVIIPWLALSTIGEPDSSTLPIGG